MNAFDRQKIEEVQKLCDDLSLPMSLRLVLVNIRTQTLHLIESQKLVKSYPISTGLKGVGQEQDSGKTPLGLHLIQSKIGEGADPFAVFHSRLLTGAIAIPNGEGDLIVGRILWLHGLQPQFNQGMNVDTYSRYIYIHGTNDIANIGKPVSAGCVRMI